MKEQKKEFESGDIVFIRHYVGVYDIDEKSLAGKANFDNKDYEFIFIENTNKTIKVDKDLRYGEVGLTYDFDSKIYNRENKKTYLIESKNLSTSLEESIDFQNKWGKCMDKIVTVLNMDRKKFINE